MKNEMAWATAGRHAAQGVAWALCDIEMCERIEALEAKLATTAPCPGEPVATEPDYESWVGDLVMHPELAKPHILIELVDGDWARIGSCLFSIIGLRLATESERRAYTGTPPTEAGQWCMIRDKENQDWPLHGVREFAARTKNGRWYCVHCLDGTAISSFKFARLLTPKEIRDHGKDEGDEVRELAKAGALIAAEIDRLQRKGGAG